MFLHKEGKVAEYQHGSIDGDMLWRVSGSSGFDLNVSVYDDSLMTKEEAYAAAMDYHEIEGCKLYLELYPAPEKGEWDWIAQDASGHWYGYFDKPTAGNVCWAVFIKNKFICESPPNPFWRKTLQ